MNKSAILLERHYDLPMALPVKDFSLDGIREALKEKFSIWADEVVTISSSTSETVIGIKELNSHLKDYMNLINFTGEKYAHVIQIKYIKLG